MRSLSAALGNALWAPDPAERSAILRFVRTLARYVYALGRDLLGGQLTLRATGLVYITLLSVVPLLAFSFSLVKAFGLHNALEPQLYRLMEPLGTRGSEITASVIRAVDSLDVGVLGPLSLAFVIWSAIAMVREVEESFNYVWQVTRPRSLARRVTEYVTVLLIGPVLLAVALGLLSAIGSDALLQRIAAAAPVGPLLLAAGEILPYLLVIAVFTFLYAFLPNTPVRIGAAAAGGVVAGTIWALVGALFTSVVAESGARNAIYGTFAVTISALVWLFLNWLIMLVGAQIAFYVQNPGYLRSGRQAPRLSNGIRERLALEIMYQVGLAFRTGDAPCTTARLSAVTRVPGLTLGLVIAELESAGLISATREEALIPGRDLSRITLAEVLDAVRGGRDTGALESPAWSAPVEGLAGLIQSGIEARTAGMNLGAFLDSGPAPSPAD